MNLLFSPHPCQDVNFRRVYPLFQGALNSHSSQMEIRFSPVSIPPSGRLLPPPVLVHTPLRHGRPATGIVSCHCGMECVGRGLHLPASLSRDCKCQQCEQLVFRLGPPPTSHSPPLSLPRLNPHWHVSSRLKRSLIPCGPISSYSCSQAEPPLARVRRQALCGPASQAPGRVPALLDRCRLVAGRLNGRI